MLDFGTLFYIVNAAIPLILIFSALLMFSLSIPLATELDNYRASRKIIAYAYLIFGVFSGMNAFMNGSGTSKSDMLIVAAMSLIIASFQSFLFTYTLIILINPSFFTRRWLLGQLIPISVFSVLSFFFLFLSDASLRAGVFYSFFTFYIYQLFFYTHTFIKEYKQYHSAAGNYFSGDEAKRLNWVAVAFFSALSIGVLVLTLIVYPNPVYDLIVAVLCGIFYTGFLVGYINYPYIFNKVIIEKEEPIADVNEDRVPQYGLTQLIEQWIAAKSYVEPNITIIGLANALNTNRTYLSAYINNNMRMNFNTWVNALRIEDAKKLLKETTDLSIADIAARLGYADHSSFSRQFKKNTGLSPIEWKKKHG